MFSPDGRRLYFYSKRPVDGARDPEANRFWYVERSESGEDWGAPQRPPLPDAMTASQWGPSVTADGTLYYNTPGRSNGGIDRSRRVNGQYGRVERLTERVNSGHLDWTVHVAPDESYLIFSSDRSGGSGGGDLYVCFRETSGAWSKPRAMPESINTASQERFPLVSPDGRFLFFTRWTPRHSQEIYWVGAGVIQDMKEAWLRELARGSTPIGRSTGAPA